MPSLTTPSFAGTTDLRLALRGFRRRPAYAATVVITLALAVGAAGTIWNALWAVVVRPLPFTDDASLVILEQIPKSTAAVSVGVSPPEIADYREQTSSFTALSEYHVMDFTLLGHGEPRRVQTGVVSPHHFAMLGVRPSLGRDFVATDDTHDARPVLLLSDRFWRAQFQADPTIVGADFTMNDRVHTVIGVLPPMPALAPGREIDVWMPVVSCPFRSGENWSHGRGFRGLTVFGRLKPGVTHRSAELDVRTVFERLVKGYPADYPEALGLAPRLVGLRDALTAEARPTLWLLVGAAGFVLLLVCANLVNLTLAQLQRREGEFAMRAALGGTRFRLARQLATESAVLALGGGVLGVGLAIGAQGAMVGVLGRLTPRAAEMRVDVFTVVSILGLALLIGAAIGTLAALRRRDDLVSALRADGSNATAVGRSLRLRDALVVTQVAASFVLLVGAGLLVRSYRNLDRVEPGFRNRQVLTLHLPHNFTKYPDTERQAAYIARLLDGVRAVPGVERVAIAESYPLNAQLPFNRRLAIGRTPPDVAQAGPAADFRFVSPEYFETLGIPLLSGRPLAEADRDPQHAVALVNAAFVRAVFPDRDPLGQQVTFARGTASWTVVGVVGDVRQRGLASEVRPELYAPVAITGLGDKRLFVSGRDAADPLGLVPALREALRAIDPEQPVLGVRTLEGARRESLAAPRATAALLALAAVVALVIAAAGLAGLLAYSLGQRQREFGIRLALGASRLDIARLVLTRTGGLVGLGAVLGIGLALVTSRGLASLLFGLATTDLVTYATVGAVLGGAAFLACLPSLRRALATPPSLALRAL